MLKTSEHIQKKLNLNNICCQQEKEEKKTIGENNLIRIPDRIICTTSLIDEIYGDGELELDYLASLNVAILTPTNKNSLEINEIVLVRMISNIK